MKAFVLIILFTAWFCVNICFLYLGWKNAQRHGVVLESDRPRDYIYPGWNRKNMTRAHLWTSVKLLIAWLLLTIAFLLLALLTANTL